MIIRMRACTELGRVSAEHDMYIRGKIRKKNAVLCGDNSRFSVGPAWMVD